MNGCSWRCARRGRRQRWHNRGRRQRDDDADGAVVVVAAVGATGGASRTNWFDRWTATAVEFLDRGHFQCAGPHLLEDLDRVAGATGVRRRRLHGTEPSADSRADGTRLHLELVVCSGDDLLRQVVDLEHAHARRDRVAVAGFVPERLVQERRRVGRDWDGGPPACLCVCGECCLEAALQQETRDRAHDEATRGWHLLFA